VNSNVNPTKLPWINAKIAVLSNAGPHKRSSQSNQMHHYGIPCEYLPGNDEGKRNASLLRTV
jgi:hypothetical protein